MNALLFCGIYFVSSATSSHLYSKVPELYEGTRMKASMLKELNRNRQYWTRVGIVRLKRKELNAQFFGV